MTFAQAGGWRVWSTDAVPSRNALDYWVATVCDHLLEMEIETQVRTAFQGHLRQSTLGLCGLNLIEAEQQQIQRTRAMIERSQYANYQLLYFREGCGTVAQRGRTAFVKPGDCVLLDSTETYELSFPRRTSCTAILLPRDWLRGWIRTPDTLLARPFNVSTGWGAALAAWLKCLDPDSIDRSSLPTSVLAEQLAALLAMAGDEPAAQARPRWHPLFNRLLATLRERCADPDLSPGVVAAEHRISRRYLHMLFSRAGTTFGDSLVSVRLEQAHRLLSDGRYADMPIGEIAARCGFREASHFARRFRSRFGSTPTQVRQQRGCAGKT